MTHDPTSPRALIVARNDELAHHIVGAFADVGVVAIAAYDRDTLRASLLRDTLVAVAVHDGVGADAADAVARAARVGRATPIVTVLLTDDVRAHEPSRPFDITLKYPVAGRVLASRIQRALAGASNPRPADDRELRAEIEMRGELDGMTHYQILGVRPDASADRVTAAWDRLSLVLHPDRLRNLSDDALRARATTLYDRVGEAYRTLRRPNARMRYDQALSRGTDVGGGRLSDRALTLIDLSDRPNTRKYLQLAQAALNGRDQRMALVQLRFAASLEPENAEIISEIGRLEALLAPS